MEFTTEEKNLLLGMLNQVNVDPKRQDAVAVVQTVQSLIAKLSA